uniref:Uncharacterized protein n=1 Tax=Electrophorus electricus TaxID=8005 RepID=A0A4W4FZG4_ELEEL
MAEIYPWWKSFAGMKKNKILIKSVQQDAEKESKPVDNPSVKQGADNKPSRLKNDSSYEDSQFEPVFNENTCRRNMKVSRSGRFREKRRVRVPLPVSGNLYDNSTAAANIGFNGTSDTGL